MSGDEGLELRIEMTRDDLEAEKRRTVDRLPTDRVERLGRTSGPGLEEARFVETVAIIGTVTIAMLARRLVDDWLKNREQGVQINLGTATPTVSTIANVPRGFVLVVDKDGQARPYKLEYEQDVDVVPLLSKLLGGART
jgi:hypothetical protein